MGSRASSEALFFGCAMDRFAVFVDAGYLYAEGGKLCCGTGSRIRFTVDTAKLNAMLRELSSARCGLDYLRTYWYDGARKRVRTVAQQDIAALPNLKLRLGRVSARGQQKGVDALIYRDLMTLAHERAISEAFLLSGDEDLQEGVKAAQDRGVRVTLIGIEPEPGKRNQSQELVYETDEVVVLTRKELSPYFALHDPARIRRRSAVMNLSLVGNTICEPVARECKQRRDSNRDPKPAQNTAAHRYRIDT